MFWTSKVYFCSRSHGFCSRDQNASPLFFEKKLQKHDFLKNDSFMFFSLSLKVFEPQRSTISQIKPLEAYFWPFKVQFCSRNCGFSCRDQNACPRFLRHPLVVCLAFVCNVLTSFFHIFKMIYRDCGSLSQKNYTIMYWKQYLLKGMGTLWWQRNLVAQYLL